MSNEYPDPQAISGECLDDGGVRLEADGNSDAWIEADYREGWWRRKLLQNDKSAYEDMVEAFFLECQACHRYMSPQIWTEGSAFCPGCEMKFESIGSWFERTEGGIAPDGRNRCPDCGSTNIDVGRIADYDSVCNECDKWFHLMEASTA